MEFVCLFVIWSDCSVTVLLKAHETYFFIYSLLSRIGKYTHEMLLKRCILFTHDMKQWRVVQHPSCQYYLNLGPKHFFNLCHLLYSQQTASYYLCFTSKRLAHYLLHASPTQYLLHASPTQYLLHASPTQYLLHAWKSHPLSTHSSLHALKSHPHSYCSNVEEIFCISLSFLMLKGQEFPFVI
jgi:hypothetical protein